MTKEKESMEEIPEEKQTTRRTRSQSSSKKTKPIQDVFVEGVPTTLAPADPVAGEKLETKPKQSKPEDSEQVSDSSTKAKTFSNKKSSAKNSPREINSKDGKRPTKQIEKSSPDSSQEPRAHEIPSKKRIQKVQEVNAPEQISLSEPSVLSEDISVDNSKNSARRSKASTAQMATKKTKPNFVIEQAQLTHIERKSLSAGESKGVLEEYDSSTNFPQIMTSIEVIPFPEKLPAKHPDQKEKAEPAKTFNTKRNSKKPSHQDSTSVITAIMEEAPIAVLPEEIFATESSSGTNKKHRSRSKTKQRAVEEAKTDPIPEGGDLALIEAEHIVKEAASKRKKGGSPKDMAERVLYISSESDDQVEVVITEKGIVTEYFVEMAHQSKIRGNIYKGVVSNIDSNLQAAFVNFGTGKNGFLQIDEIHSEYWLVPHLEGGKYPPIQKAIKIGQEILVQVVKEPSGNKGAFLTTWVSIAGRFLVLTPGQEQIGVSRKVTDNEERVRLKSLLSGINPGEDFGVIIRTVSEGASKVSIKKDLQYLKRAWKDITKKIAKQKAPSLVYKEADLASRAIRDYLSENIREIWVDSATICSSLEPFIKFVLPKKADVLKLHTEKGKSLWEHFNIVSQLEDVAKREVNLPSGGQLVFDQTEALMAIDINSGKTHGKSNFEAMVFRTNMEAAEAIARHLRLRDVGGQVVIDFIEMKDRGHIREVEKALREAMRRDKARHDIGSISSFALLELVRQRTGNSAISLSSEPCPHCQGTGFRRNMEWQAQKMLRELKNKLSSKKPEGSYVCEIEHEVGLYILNRKRDRLNELEEQFQIKLEIRLG